MALEIKRKGFGQVELNQVAGGMITGQLVDQVPASKDEELLKGCKILEQGRFVKVQTNEDGTQELVADKSVEGPWVMIYNEEYFYDERDMYHKDFAMRAEDYIDEIMVPRCYTLIKTDKFTTNCFVCQNTGKNAEVEESIELKCHDFVGVGDDGYLVAWDEADQEGPKFEVIKEYTMPDMQPAVKLYCVVGA